MALISLERIHPPNTSTMDFTKYHLKEKYRKVLDNLSDEDKIRNIFKNIEWHEKASTWRITSDIITYYELKDHPLHKELALNKFKEPETAYRYAKEVIQGRWHEAEETIKTIPKYAYLYAVDVIKGHWIEAEETIKKSPEYAFFYARYVIKDRWLEAEEIIKINAYWAYFYSLYVIKGRWIEAEPYIKKDPYYLYYSRDLEIWDSEI